MKDFATKLIKDTFESDFDKDQYVKFLKNLLNSFDDKPFGPYSGQYIKKPFQDGITSYERVGQYKDPDGKIVDLLIVNLRKKKTLDYARTLQRNFVADYLDGGRGGISRDAALAAFVSDESQDWRFSLVKMDYIINEGRVVSELTPARRYSYLVGPNEKSHTAKSRLVPIIKDDTHNPSLKQLEEAFSIEKVTKEFFEKYRDLFHRLDENLIDTLEKDPKIRQDFETKDIETSGFTKKLLGQIVFLYFLQKKGWFGVERDAEWGTGPKNFLRKLFEKEIIDYGNFFNNVLEPLFYEALAVERQDNWSSRFNCKIPFLNGGLFDPINNYDWVHTDILIENELFSNNFQTKEGDIGTGILDVFDRYNFTVQEDEPLEKEVAVDPEMLGKVFENLLEVKDRKSKGTYYTPREIVHYMCQESLINYLNSKLGGIVNRNDLEEFVKYGERAIENDILLENNNGVSGGRKYEISQSIREKARLVDQELSNIKVCDPAIGSGAFPVGMMSEIVKCRNILSSYLENKNGRSFYDLKRHAIQESIHGVDIDPSAVEIAKLRLWLSLIVDEDDISNIKPLPNLDYKIMQGNSLLEEYEGVKLVDDRLFENGSTEMDEAEQNSQKQNSLQKEFFNSSSEIRKNAILLEVARLTKLINKLKSQGKPNLDDAKISLFAEQNEKKEKLNTLFSKQKQFFNATQKSEKDRLKSEVEKLTWDLIETSLRNEGKTAKLNELIVLKNKNIKPFFLWKLNFFDVFKHNGGFDIVIGNPPWEKVKPQDPEFFRLYEPDYRKKSKAIQKEIKDRMLRKAPIKRAYELFVSSRLQIMSAMRNSFHMQGSSDTNYYKLFIEKSFSLSKSVICWVIPGSMTIDEGSYKMRQFLLDQNFIDKIIGFSNKEGVFEWVDNNQKFMILSLKKNRQASPFSIVGWLTNADDIDRAGLIEIPANFYKRLDVANLTYYLDTTKDSFSLLSKFIEDKRINTLRDIKFHYWQEYHATSDARYFDDTKGKHMLFSGKAINQFDCMAKTWLEEHGRSSKWKKLSFSKNESEFRTEYYVSEIPDRIVTHHKQDVSDFRIVIQNVTGTVNNIRTVYACALHKKHLTNNSLHNLYIGTNDRELFYYLAILNSFVLDWQARIKVATNLNKFILESFFIPKYEFADNKLRNQLADISFWLSDVCSDFGSMGGNFNKQHFASREEAIVLVNAIAAKLYHLDSKELTFILSYFDLVDEKLKRLVVHKFNKI